MADVPGFCVTCQQITLHRDGACLQCAFRRQAVMPGPAPGLAPTEKPGSSAGTIIAITLASCLAVGGAFYGAWHFLEQTTEDSVDKLEQAISTAGVEGTRLQIQKYAFEAYPMWQAAHPDQRCPASLDDLNEYISATDSVDLWGHALKMHCGPNAPSSTAAFGVQSLGPDGIIDDCDDVYSWEPPPPCGP